MKGAATYLEADLDTKLLWLACRHNVLELIAGAVWTSNFGPTKSASNLEFKKFLIYSNANCFENEGN